MNNLIYEIIIENYPDKILVSKSRRPILYVSEQSKVKGKTNIPKSFLNKDKYDFDAKGVLYDKSNGLPKIANPGTAGNPRYFIINNQAIWNGALSGPQRANITNKLKDIIRPYFIGLPRILNYPIKIEKFIFSPTMNIDVDNKSVIYTKVIQDIMKELNIIPDDSSVYINDTGRLKWIKSEENKMVIRISKSDNEVN